MIRFKDFMEQAPSKKYVSVEYDAATQRKLREWAKENGFDLSVGYSGSKQKESDFDFHTTIFYTTTAHDIPNHEKILPSKGSANVVGFEMFGENKNIPVLIISSSVINGLRKHYEETYKMQDQWPTFKPHVSVSYATDALPDVESIKLPDFELTFNKVKVEDLLNA